MATATPDDAGSGAPQGLGDTFANQTQATVANQRRRREAADIQQLPRGAVRHRGVPHRRPWAQGDNNPPPPHPEVTPMLKSENAQITATLRKTGVTT